MSINVLIVTPDGASELRPITPDLATLQGLVGGLIQPVRGYLEDAEVAWTAYVNEEGKWEGAPFNPYATALATALGWPGTLAGDFLVGTAVFVGDGGSVDAAVPNEVIVTLAALRAAGQA